ncbi:MAG: zf-HC2 domain-containing protein [Deltaproteobacteria bacterium]|nr:zf-HC2 domain-containing protein [Deltaproteobacteria bacterium]
MSTCEVIRESLGAWLDGELSGAAADTVRSHLQTCLACGQERRQLEKLDITLKSVLEAQTIPFHAESIWHALRQRIETKRPWYVEVAAWTGPVLRSPSFAWGVPAVIVLLLGTIYLDSILPGWNSGSPRDNFAAVESIDAYGRNVALLREYETKTTVIWLYQNPDSESEASGETSNKGPAF